MKINISTIYHIYKRFIARIPAPRKRGISLVISLIMTTLLLAISLSIGSIILRQLRITSISTNSQSAFYAADSALDCALYWDTKTDGTLGEGSFESAIFGTSTEYDPGTTPIKCGSNNRNPLAFMKEVDGINDIATSTFDLDYGNTCARVQVVKNPNRTTISTRGYNTTAGPDFCDLDNAVERRLVERGLIFKH